MGNPQITSLSLPAVDFLHGSGKAELSATATDASSAVKTLILTLDHPIYDFGYIGHGRVDTYTTNTLVFGVTTGVDGGYLLSDMFYPSQLTKAGSYTVTEATITDADGSALTYSTADLKAQGFDAVLTVLGDSTPPTLNSLFLAFPSNGAIVPSAIITINASETGSSLPFYYAIVNLDHAIGNGTREGGIYVNTTSSNVLTGPSIPIMSEADASRTLAALPGEELTYNINSIVLVDFSGNQTIYSEEQLANSGFGTQFTLSRDSVADFNGDSLSDILWRNENGALSTWSAGAGNTIVKDTSDAVAETSWHVIDTLDWNSDGKADLVWHNDGGGVSIWTGTGHGFQQSTFLDTTVASDWSIVGAGDFDGDGRSDLLWRRQDGTLSTWIADGSGFRENAYSRAAVSADWKVEGVGDFSDDGLADILWRNDDGAVSTWNATRTGFMEASTLYDPVDRSWHIVGIGDFNGDGSKDILWHNDNGHLSVWEGGFNGFREDQFDASAGTDWSVAQVADFNGDGLSDLLWHKDSGAISIWSSTGSGWSEDVYSDASVAPDWSIAAHRYPL